MAIIILIHIYFQFHEVLLIGYVVMIIFMDFVEFDDFTLIQGQEVMHY